MTIGKPFSPHNNRIFGNPREGNYTEFDKDGNIIQHGTAGASFGSVSVSGTLTVTGNSYLSDTEIDGPLTLVEQSADPADPAEGKAVVWMSDGTGTGADGDLLYKEQSGAVVEQGSLKWKDFTPSSLTVNTSDGTTGTVANVQVMLDGTAFNIEEAAGVPGFDVEFNFTGIDRYPSLVVCRWQYDGSSTHYVTIDIYNYRTTSWDALRVFKDSALYYSSMTMMIPVVNQSDYVDGSGNAIVRFYHHTSGNASHDLHIDYVGLAHALQGVI